MAQIGKKNYSGFITGQYTPTWGAHSVGWLSGALFSSILSYPEAYSFGVDFLLGS